MGIRADSELDWHQFSVARDYKWVMFVAMLIVLHYFVCLVTAGKPRGKLFSQDWMDDNFGKTHEQEVGDKITKGGYPDHGSGRYTIEKGYEAWFQFMLAQRVHYNYLEAIMQMLCNVIFAGLYYPRATAIWGGIYLAARLVYHIGYLINPKARMIGAPIMLLSQFAFPVFTIVSLSKFAGISVPLSSFDQSTVTMNASI